MLHDRPDFLIHCGDSIYADCIVPETQRLPNGEIWRNVVTEEKSKVATTLSDYRGNYKYNLLDANVLAFNAEVPIFAQWDNHEVMDIWWPEETFNRPDYNVNSALLLMSGVLTDQFAQPAPSIGKHAPLYQLATIGAIFAGLTLATPFAFRAGGDNAFIAVAIPASLLTIAATHVNVIAAVNYSGGACGTGGDHDHSDHL